MKIPKIAGITRIRNESLIIQETLDHFADFCNAGIYVFDDASTDNTVKICKQHKAVKSVIGVREWDNTTDLHIVEAQQRKAIVEEAKKDNPDWLLYLDADERLFWNFEELSDDYDFVAGRLFDFYITEEDKDRKYSGNLSSMRRYCGPEYRDIIYMMKASNQINFDGRNCRNPITLPSWKGLYTGRIKHYGKAMSVKHWEDKCHFYINRSPDRYKALWQRRLGKAVHTESDFHRPLYTWSGVCPKVRPLQASDYAEEETIIFK